MSTLLSGESMRLEVRAGQQVIWQRIQRGGYGYIENIPAVVVSIGAKRITIEVRKANGEAVKRSVHPTHLKSAPEPTP